MLNPTPQSPSISRLIEQGSSLSTTRSDAIAVEEMTDFIADKLARDPMWEWVHNEKHAGRRVDNIGALVKARAFDIMIDYSGDLLHAGPWRTALFHAAALAAVTRICGICRLIGYIL